MTPLSREVLARDAAARLAACQLSGGAACVGQGTVWSSLESRHRRARTEAEARLLVEELRTRFCAGCPVLLGCGQWAHVQQYTGLAAGAAYEVGERKTATWVVHARRRRRQAS